MIVPASELMPVIRASLEGGQRVRMTVNGSSMLPFIRDNDTVELEPLRSLPAKYDVVLAQSPDKRYVLHRVIRIEGEVFFLRGDANLHVEGPFTVSDALGRVTTFYHRGRAHELNSGVWRLAGRVWTCCHPLGSRLLRFVLPVWRLGKRCLVRVRPFLRRSAGGLTARLRAVPAVRAGLKRISVPCVIQEAGVLDLMAVNAWLNPSAGGDPPPTDPSITNYVAKRGNRVIGLVRLGRRHDANPAYTGHWLWSLTVREPYRGMGLGEALTNHVIGEAQREGAPALFLAVTEGNFPAVRLYRKLGFERVVLPEVEEQLIAEAQQLGRRRVTLRRVLAP